MSTKGVPNRRQCPPERSLQATGFSAPLLFQFVILSQLAPLSRLRIEFGGTRRRCRISSLRHLRIQRLWEGPSDSNYSFQFGVCGYFGGVVRSPVSKPSIIDDLESPSHRLQCGPNWVTPDLMPPPMGKRWARHSAHD